MNLYLDTSSLFKLYHKEPGTEIIDQFFSTHKIESIFLSEIANVEFASAVYRKVRMKKLNFDIAEELMNLFDNDFEKYEIIPINRAIIKVSKQLLMKYGQLGLRTLDALQLASALEVRDVVDKYFTSDSILLSLFEKEKLPV